jgi:hypothetical protein
VNRLLFCAKEVRVDDDDDGVFVGCMHDIQKGWGAKSLHPSF